MLVSAQVVRLKENLPVGELVESVAVPLNELTLFPWVSCDSMVISPALPALIPELETARWSASPVKITVRGETCISS